MTRTASWRPLRLCVSALFVSALVRAESPGTHYPSGGTRPGVSPQASAGTNAPYARTITIYGSVNTNDLLRFLDRTGSRVAGTNVLGALDCYGTNWQAVVYSHTNGAALGATALQASWASTGTVAHAVTAARITVAGDADYWLSVCGGTGTLFRVSDDTNSIRVVSVSEDFTANGITPGLVITPIMTLEEFPNIVFWGNTSGNLAVQFLRDMSVFEIYDADTLNWVATASDLPATLYRDGSGSCVIDYVPVTNSYALATLADLAPLPTFADLNASNAADRAYADAAVNAAPAWIGITNLATAVTITNSFERPVYLYATGTVSVTFSGLRTPMPLYLIVRGPDSLTIPGAYYVGGGTWQTNMSNHFVVWTYGTNLFVNPVTASED